MLNLKGAFRVLGLFTGIGSKGKAVDVAFASAGGQGGGSPLKGTKGDFMKKSLYFFAPKFGGLWGLKERIPKGAQGRRPNDYSYINKSNRTRTRNILDISVRTDVNSDISAQKNALGPIRGPEFGSQQEFPFEQGKLKG